MGRRIKIKKTEEMTRRQVTFSKRRTCLLKKVKEIAICCDVDVLFVAFSSADRLSKFCSQRRIEDMLQRYIELPVERRLTHMADVQNLELQIKKSTLELQILDANIRDFEPGPGQVPSLHQLIWCERNLQLSLERVEARKMELEKQEKMDIHFVAQQTAPQQFDTNNWINPYSSSQSGNLPFFQSQNSSPYIPLQSQQQNIMVDVQQNLTQTFGQLQSQLQNMVVDVQQNPTQIFGQSQAQMTFGESNDNSLFNFLQNICDSTRSVSCPLVTTGTQLNNPFQLGLENDNATWNNNLNNPSSFGLENAHSNWNNNMSNNNNYINEHNDPSSVQNDAIAPNVNGFNYSMEENAMGNNEYFAETTHENDAWKWDMFLNEAFNGEDF
ncbi:hypothetical protein H5410_022910 [Solanum commersonii]|uniref:MADS-box domain-containing protein n=1 Tax=Solanum commersonii TaxID=4109 RepID=A0A9J5ZGS8_SOLCO|nr:hypothetical protein H5410_022910 [Solanum commersonii]